MCASQLAVASSSFTHSIWLPHDVFVRMDVLLAPLLSSFARAVGLEDVSARGAGLVDPSGGLIYRAHEGVVSTAATVAAISLC